VDAAAAFPDGTQFRGVAGLKALLASHRSDFVAIFTEKLLTYALGREVEYYDYPAIRKIMQESAGGDYRWSSVLVGIVKSMPFQMSVVRSAPPQNEIQRSSAK